MLRYQNKLPFPDNLHRKRYKKVCSLYHGLPCLITCLDLSNFPLGALRKAQYTLGQAEVYSESEADDESNQSSGDDGESKDQSKGKRKPEWSLKPKSEIPKRRNKHTYVLWPINFIHHIDVVPSPMEISSKRPVTRRRQVVEVKNSVSGLTYYPGARCRHVIRHRGIHGSWLRLANFRQKNTKITMGSSAIRGEMS